MPLTGAAERLLGGDALVAGRTQRGSRHGQRGEEVTVTVASLSLSRRLLSLSHPLSLLVLEGGEGDRLG